VPHAPREVVADTVERALHPTTQLSSLSAWVDSAVLANPIAPPAGGAGDAARPDSTVSKAETVAAADHETTGNGTRFRNGAPAPDTASPLPLIALAGAVLALAGLGLRRRPLRVVGVATLGGVALVYAWGIWAQHDARRQWVDAAASAAAVRRVEGTSTATGTTPVLGEPMARLLIPSLGEDDIVFEGVGAEQLNGGPGHLPGSAIPGESGNAVVSAHRDRHFRKLGRLVVGDTIVTETRDARVVWRVTDRRIVAAGAPALFASTEPVLTVTTCWPMNAVGPAPERLILTARRVRTMPEAS
jgi:sortase A